MENASKALIIAGAILLSILIIALGIYVFNMAKGVTDTKALNDLEIQQFNSQFTAYRGKVIGSGVVTLLDKLISNAVSNKDTDDRLPDIFYYSSSSTHTIVAPKYSHTSLGSSSEFEHARIANNKASSLLGSEYEFKFYLHSKSGIGGDNEGLNNVEGFSDLRSKIAEKHYYRVEFLNDDNTGLISYVIIAY